MGRTKKNKPRHKLRGLHDASQRRTARTRAAQIAWTPLKQACGCVVDWGWSSQTADPMTFMEWCPSRLTVSCPWHADPLAGASGTDLPDELVVQPHGTSVLLHARKAAADRHELGGELATRLAHVLETAGRGEQALLDDAPAGFRSWLIANTADPAQAWLEHELCEIILNQGRCALPRELLEHLPEQLLTPSSESLQPESAACNICSFSAANGGILCACGHDWSCHPGEVRQGEPCSHCACTNMQHV
ncbi:hypothetical protein StrepF001_12955 [Streptomyces sp. F001]|uniref:hypothetical protein n=1 Tax=Streptomyces sp. F001 TaxID=1510026 RepID=UPI00101E71D1|nr:hypothetical protein [Streptomyces sp. F001]RZB19628.1 hypothetical protein StrepF001_12955 [Streptomyces sp. F001]